MTAASAGAAANTATTSSTTEKETTSNVKPEKSPETSIRSKLQNLLAPDKEKREQNQRDAAAAAAEEDASHTGLYDTVTSVHDIEQDDHNKYVQAALGAVVAAAATGPQSLRYESSKLGKIVEVPSKNITRNNSLSDLEHGNSKL